MYIKVQLLNGFTELLWYEQPITWPESVLGAIVRVPLRNQQVSALVIDQQHRKPLVPFAIRLATALEPIPDDSYHSQFIRQLSAYYQIAPITLIKRMKQFLFQKEVHSLPLELPNSENKTNILLTTAQQTIVDTIKPSIIDATYLPYVMHGVTGSGKTEIYKELIKVTYAQRKTTVLLLPEVTLALEFAQRLQQELASSIIIFSFHSATPPKEKRLFCGNNFLQKNRSLLLEFIYQYCFLYRILVLLLLMKNMKWAIKKKNIQK
jgi:primosomal protein N' (replication factor Y)